MGQILHMANSKFSSPSNASPWLCAALKSALRRDPAEAFADATTLAGILRKRCRVAAAVQQGADNKSPAALDESKWEHVGDVAFFDLDTDRSYLVTLGSIRGWRVSVVKDRKAGKWRVMAMARLPAKPAQA